MAKKTMVGKPPKKSQEIQYTHPRSLGMTKQVISQATRPMVSKANRTPIARGAVVKVVNQGAFSCGSVMACPGIVNLSDRIDALETAGYIVCADLATSCLGTIQDIVGAMAIGGTQSGITVAYDNVGGFLDFTVAGATPLVIEDEGIALANQPTMNFTGAGVNVTTGGGKYIVTIPGGAAVDELVKISATDTTAGYLNAKINNSSTALVAENGILKAIVSPGGNESERLILDLSLYGGDAVFNNLTINGTVTGSDISVRARMTVAQSIPQASTPVLLTFGGEDFDTDNMHDNAINPERITINTAGKYHVGANTITDPTFTNTTQGASILIRLNGTTYIGGGTAGGYVSFVGVPQIGSASAFYDFIAGDYLEVFITGDNVGPTSIGTDTSFWAYRKN